MGWMSDKQAEAAKMIRAVIEPSVPAGETLRGAVYANKKSSFSAKLYAIGVTDQHLLIQPIDRKWKPEGAPVPGAWKIRPYWLLCWPSPMNRSAAPS